jgi:signal transduction histidine kinase
MGTTETTIYYAIVIASLVIGTLLLYFFIVVVHHQRINVDLRKKNTLDEIVGLEKERARIASDLHDELAPILSTVKTRLNYFSLTDPDELLEREEANAHIDEIIKRMREISFNLMPHTLLKNGLATALEEYVDFLNRGHHIRFLFVCGNSFQMDECKSVHIYRILQEVIHNAIKYSGASEISIEMRNRKNEAQIKVSDDGCGFDYKKKVAERVGIGLGSIRNRVMICGGKMFVDSGLQKGTTYIFEIPI